jgi:NAD(P)-dependent dehydrogenase (short-subunit alcohol dehydrogenase family)
LAQGAFVTIPYQKTEDKERLKEVVSPADYAKLRFVAADLLDEQNVQHLVDDMPQVDVLIHLVGGFAIGATHTYRFADWQRDFDLNLSTAFLACKHSLRKMLEHGYGRIVTVAARGAVEPSGQLAAYCASKAGVVALTKAIADETKGSSITANVVLPSIIDTPTNRKAMGTENAHQWVKPESLAQVICFLASEAAQDVRGAAVPVYGNS